MATNDNAPALRPATPAAPEGATVTGPVRPKIRPENHGLDVWHLDCPEIRCGPMKHLRQPGVTAEGWTLWLYECPACGVRAYAGGDPLGRILVRLPEEVRNA